MLAAVRSATLLGVEGRPVTVEVHVSTGLARLPDRRPARRGVPRIARSCSRRGAVQRAAVAVVQDDRQPCAVEPAQGWFRARSGDRDRAADRQRRDSGRRRRPTSASSASWVSTDRCAPVAGVAPMVGALDDLTAVVPRASFREAHGHLARARAGCCAPSRGHRRPQRRRAVARRARRRLHRRRPTDTRPRRRARPGDRPQGVGGRRGRRAPPVAGRPAGLRQDDAGATHAGPAAAADAGAGARGHDGALGRGRSAAVGRA